MTTTCHGNRIFIFGGFVGEKYSDANVTILTTWNPDLPKFKSVFGTKKLLSG